MHKSRENDMNPCEPVIKFQQLLIFYQLIPFADEKNRNS